MEWAKEIHEKLKKKEALRKLYYEVLNETLDELRKEIGHDKVRHVNGECSISVGSLNIKIYVDFESALEEAFKSVISFNVVTKEHFQAYIRNAVKQAIGEK